VRISRSVLREAGGETPPAYSPVIGARSKHRATSRSLSFLHKKPANFGYFSRFVRWGMPPIFILGHCTSEYSVFPVFRGE
jgi:hypothetical protein